MNMYILVHTVATGTAFFYTKKMENLACESHGALSIEPDSRRFIPGTCNELSIIIIYTFVQLSPKK